jgi:hypothetical protein
MGFFVFYDPGYGTIPGFARCVFIQKRMVTFFAQNIFRCKLIDVIKFLVGTDHTLFKINDHRGKRQGIKNPDPPEQILGT